MKLVNKRDGKIVVEKLKMADSMLTRMKGLMFDKTMPAEEGLLINPCNSIHTFFMNFPIDVVFLNKQMKVVKIIKQIRPWRMTGIYLRASMTLELPGGTLVDQLKVGDELEVKDV